MRKLLASGLVSLVLSLSLLAENPEKTSLRKGRVGRIIDGDTIELVDKTRLRFANTNSPEKDSSLYRNSLAYVNGLVGREILFEELGKDRNRIVARIYSQSSYVNLESVRQGYSSKFMVQENELRLFDRAERQAIEREIGIWKKSPYFGKLGISLDPEEDSVTIENISFDKTKNPISINGWQMKDESRETYIFPDLSLGSITIFSGPSAKRAIDSGKVAKGKIIWTPKNVWNNNRDTFYLFDSQGRIVTYYSYGYEESK